ncbi:MAG TPA: hypothetical protein VFT13_02620 [Candidatus Krumholzibacteria bacterium]|nr:hypothetical protein [Candidatus Krumholzibacteria bacterium]
MFRFRTFTIPSLAIVIVAMLFAAPAQATSFGVRAGYYFDADAVSIGTEMLTPLSESYNWYFNPNFELAVGDVRDIVAMNADFHYDFQPSSDLAVWAGAGPAIFVIDRGRFEDEKVDVGANLLFGLGANHGSVRPYGQFKAVLMDDPEAAIAFGVRF